MFSKFPVVRDLRISLEKTWKDKHHKTTDGRSHLRDHRRVKTWFGIQKGRDRMPEDTLLGGKNVTNLEDKRVFSVEWDSTSGTLCSYSLRVFTKTSPTPYPSSAAQVNITWEECWSLTTWHYQLLWIKNVFYSCIIQSASFLSFWYKAVHIWIQDLSPCFPNRLKGWL